MNDLESWRLNITLAFKLMACRGVFPEHGGSIVAADNITNLSKRSVLLPAATIEPSVFSHTANNFMVAYLVTRR